MYFDDACRTPTKERKDNLQDNVAEIGIVFVPHKTHFSLTMGSFNNTDEYGTPS